MIDKPTKQSGDKNIHDGHRKRLFNLAYRAGLDALGEIQALEMVLCYIIPRGDVNPLAHRLLDRFGNFTSVLDASVEELQTVKGLGEESAKKLKMLTEVFLYYSTHKINPHNKIERMGDFYDYIEEMLRFRDVEYLYIFAIGRNGAINNKRELAKGKDDFVNVDMNQISLFISSSKSKNFILVHNHPQGKCHPSAKDFESYKHIKEFCKYMGGTLADSYIVGDDGIYSMDSECMVRDFMVKAKISITKSIKDLH